MEFDAKRSGSGTAEWAEVTENICIGCANNCLYCYAADKAAKMWGGWCKRAEWASERFSKRAEMKSYSAKNGIIMFPSTHDITPFNLEACIRVLKLMLAKGNHVLIVSKPRAECIHAMLQDLAPWKEQILFRFTIGSMNDATCFFWEPGASPPQERIGCLKDAFDAGYKTSVSIEPMLAGVLETMDVVEMVEDYVSETIWIGKMNKVRLRVDLTLPENAAAVANIEKLQADERIKWLYSSLCDHPMVRWKDSIKDVLAKSGITV